MKGWHAGETAGGGTFSETVAQTIEIDPYSVLLRNVNAFLKHTLEDVVHPANRHQLELTKQETYKKQ